MSLIRAVWALVDRSTRRRMRWSVAGSCALAVLDTIAVLLVFPLIQVLVEPAGSAPTSLPFGIEVGGDASLSGAAGLGAVVAVLFLSKSILAVLFLRWNLGFVLAAETSVAARVFTAQLARAPGAAALDTPGVQRTLTESLRRVFQDGLAYALPAVADQLVIALLGIAILVIAPIEALVAGTLFGAAALGYRKVIHARTSRAAARVHDEARQALALSGESLRAAREIALWGARDRFVDRYLDLRRRWSTAQRTIALNDQLPRSYLEVCLVLCTAAVAVTAFNLHPTADALALVGTFAAVGFRVLPSLNRALLAAARARTARPGLEQIRRDLDPGPATGAPGPAHTGPIERIETRDLCVRLPGRAEPILEDVSLDLVRGRIAGILGPSGAGKTTLVATLLGFLPAAAGEVRIDGRTVVHDAASWAGRAGYVPQEVVAFDAPLRENVALGIEPGSIDESRVLDALSRARLGDLLPSLPDGTATPLGESGARLSGGQRQRLGIARALYHDADVLVLDEATAGLDHDTEDRILETLHDLRHDRIVVLVSHHRSVMERCDDLIVLDRGRVIGRGDLAAVTPMLLRAGLSPSDSD